MEVGYCNNIDFLNRRYTRLPKNSAPGDLLVRRVYNIDMNLEQKIASLFRMTDEVWARHTNPWSVWTRFFALPVLILSVWSRTWIGLWAAVPILLSVVWIWISPLLVWLLSYLVRAGSSTVWSGYTTK